MTRLRSCATAMPSTVSRAAADRDTLATGAVFGVQAARKRAFEKPILYPEGLAGEAIPLSARLMAIADVYDALISRRVYKPAFTHEAAMAIVEAGRGSHFDPDIVDAFVAIQMACKAIAEKHANTDEKLGLAAPSLGAGNA